MKIKKQFQTIFLSLGFFFWKQAVYLYQERAKYRIFLDPTTVGLHSVYTWLLLYVTMINKLSLLVQCISITANL